MAQWLNGPTERNNEVPDLHINSELVLHVVILLPQLPPSRRLPRCEVVPRLRLGADEGDVDGAPQGVDGGAKQEDGAPRAKRVTALRGNIWITLIIKEMFRAKY